MWGLLWGIGAFALLSGNAWAACTLPSGAGVEGQIIYNKAHKVMQFCDGTKWVGMSGGGAPSDGAAGAVQFAGDSGAFASDPLFVWDKTTKRLGVGTASPGVALEVAGQARFANNKAYVHYYNVSPYDQAEFGSIGAATSLSFVTNSQSRMNITPGGSVGIGNVSPQAKLHVSGGNLRVDGAAVFGGHTEVQGNMTISNPVEHTYTHLRIGKDANDVLISDGGTTYGGGLWFRIHDPAVVGTNYRDVLMMAQNGNVGVSVTIPAYNLHVNGQVAGGGAFVNASDVRLKKNIAPLSYGLDSILALEPVFYEWKTQDENWQKGRKVGLIAQQVEAVVPEIVSTANDEMGTKSIAYSELVPVLIGAVKTLKSENDALRARLERVEKLLSKEAAGDF